MYLYVYLYWKVKKTNKFYFYGHKELFLPKVVKNGIGLLFRLSYNHRSTDNSKVTLLFCILK